MATVLLGETRSQFLAIPNHVRFLLDDITGTPSLAVKASSLQLKYFLTVERLSLWFVPLEGGGLAYAITIPDDPVDPAYIWSPIERDDELVALNALLDGAPCRLHLFNEIALNVASATIQFDGITDLARDLRADQHLRTVTPEAPIESARIIQSLNAMHGGQADESCGWRLDGGIGQPWHYPRSWYYSNNGRPSRLSLIDPDVGAQQEALSLWLTDVLAPEGAHLNPVVAPDQGTPRELCDVLLTSDGHSFVIESKALAVLTRPKLPTRDDLHRDVVAHVVKAAKQLSGAIRYLRLGYPVSDHHGRAVELDREKPLHLMILIPDLSLLTEADELGNTFLFNQIQKTQCYVHLLDPAQLVRVVQAATMIAHRSSHVSAITALDLSLGERLERSLELPTPDFDFLLRFADN